MTEITIKSVSIIDYRMPLKRPYGTARGVTRGSKNFLIQLLGVQRGKQFIGVGEAQPRHRLTGDVDHELAWSFLQKAASWLHNRRLKVNSKPEAMKSIRSITAKLSELAQENSVAANKSKPFRGTLLGIEVALLDLVARALEMPLADLLGKVRDDIAITVSTLSTQNTSDEFKRKVARQNRYPMVRVKGRGDFDSDSKLLDLVHSTNVTAGTPKPIWMDLNEGYDEQTAIGLIQYIASQIAAGALPEIITLEQPIPGVKADRLPHLQETANNVTEKNGCGEIRIMPDESLWDLEDLMHLNSYGHCGALNIKTAKAGGLLASLDLAHKAVALNPDVHICIGGMVGTSDITTWSLLSLAKALPRVDYITAVPPGNVEQRISIPLAKYSGPNSNVHSTSDENGIGAHLDIQSIGPYVKRENLFGEDIASALPLSDSFPAQAEDNSEIAESYQILLLGDFHYGESYGTGGGKTLVDRGYEDGTQFLKPFVDEADFTVANLETPVVDPERISTPLKGKKRYLHWSAPNGTPYALRKLGIDAVSLANNHTLDYGRDGLSASFVALAEQGIDTFGAGLSLSAARDPLQIDLPETFGGRSVKIYGLMQRPAVSRDAIDLFATADSSGCAPLDATRTSSTITENDISFHVAFPHWGPNYKWSTNRQKIAADHLLQSGYDLIVGHGAHCLQEIQQLNQRWSLFGIGNSHFQSLGRFQHFQEQNRIMPFGFWSYLIVDRWKDGRVSSRLKLYPVYSDNRITEFRPGPVDATDFKNISGRLFPGLSNFEHATDSVSAHQDRLGRYFQIELGDWSKDRSAMPSREEVDAGNPSPLLIESMPGSPAVYNDDDARRLIEIVSAGRTLGTQLIADEAEKDGALTKWYGAATCVVSYQKHRFLLQGNRSTESSVSSGVIKDKFLVKAFLRDGGARTPNGQLADSSKAARRIQGELMTGVVIKPRAGDRGRAVSVNLKDPEEIAHAYARADADGSRGVLVEEFIRGDEYRCIATDQECLSVVRRLPAHVEGDGYSSLRELIANKNKERRLSPSLYNKPISIDSETVRFLNSQGLTLNAVPDAGAKVQIRGSGNVSSGADVVECSEAADEDLKNTAVMAVRSIPGMRWAGVDIIVSPESGLSYVLEINTNSGIGSHHFPSYGAPKNIARLIWEQKKAFAHERPVLGSGNIKLELAEPTSPFDRGHQTGPQRDLPFSTILQHYLTNERNLRLTDLGGGTFEIQDSTEVVDWLRGCLTTQDLSAASVVLNRHGVVRRILRANDIPVPKGKRVRTVSGFSDYVERLGVPMKATGYLRAWGDRQSKQVGDHSESVCNDLLRSSPSLVIQECPSGARLTVIASPTRAYLAFGSSTNQSPSEPFIARAAELAVSAVAAIPEVRWAAVHIVSPMDTSPEGMLVEGINLNPVLEADAVVVAGSMNDVIDSLLVGRSYAMASK